MILIYINIMFLWDYTKNLKPTTYMTFTVTQWKSKIVNFSWGENTKRIESTCFQSYTFSRPTKVICYILISCKTWTNYLWNCTFNLSPQFYIIAIFLEFWHEMSSSSVLLRKMLANFYSRSNHCPLRVILGLKKISSIEFWF